MRSDSAALNAQPPAIGSPTGLLAQTGLALSSDSSRLLQEALGRGWINLDHLRRTFACLENCFALPAQIDTAFIEHFVMWLEVINQPYFKPVISGASRLQGLLRILLDNRHMEVRERELKVVDFGTGHPPYTTVELADALGRAEVHGIDLYEPSYMVLRPDGAFALFDDEKRLRAVQASNLRLLHRLVLDWDNTRRQFARPIQELNGHRPSPRQGMHYRRGCFAVPRPTQMLREACGNPNLRFHVNQRGGFDLPAEAPDRIDLLWSFNCLLHYSLESRLKAMSQLGRRLAKGGLMMEGYTSPTGKHAVYSIWQRRGNRLLLQEFGLSLTNLKQPLWPLHEEDPQVEAMQEIVGRAKSRSAFRRQVASEATPKGAVSRATARAMLDLLMEDGYSARLSGDDFVVIDRCPRLQGIIRSQIELS
ncbi:MAG TPA: hypothetical protein VLV83_09210 [Acidobacteriota bacterium]|nr:hypothetical protein [Acidobacteriota bacterium]